VLRHGVVLSGRLFTVCESKYTYFYARRCPLRLRADRYPGEIHALCDALIAAEGRLGHEMDSAQADEPVNLSNPGVKYAPARFGGTPFFFQQRNPVQSAFARALDEEVDHSSLFGTASASPVRWNATVDNYELVKVNGKPIELVACDGVTYKAVDVDLLCP